MASRDPYWLSVRWPGQCARCAGKIGKGGRAFYYPHLKHLLCSREECGSKDSREFEAARADERGY